MRSGNRAPDAIRPVELERPFNAAAPGSVLIRAGRTSVLCTASVEPGVPAWMAGRGRGWLTAEYSMLPGSTRPRKRRERGGYSDGRTTEIQRLVGRSLRAAIDLAALGERTVTVDCDVLEADGGTRTLSITGGFLALADALAAVLPELPGAPRLPLADSVAAVSVGMVGGQCLLDLDYREDSSATVDMNVVMTGGGRFIEVQGTGEGATFGDDDLAAMLRLARRGIAELTALQRTALGPHWPG